MRAYRELALAALKQVHDLTAALDRLREQHSRLIDEYRRLRAQTMRQAAVA